MRRSESAFRNRIETYLIVNFKHLNVNSFLEDARKKVLHKVTKKINQFKCVKANVALSTKFLVKSEETDIHVNSLNKKLYSKSDLNEWYNSLTEYILQKFTEIKKGLSNSALIEINNLSLNINKCKSYTFGGTYIESPKFIVLKRAVVNIRNKDDFGFLHCINAFVNKSESNLSHLYSYPRLSDFIRDSKIDIKNLKFPLNMGDVKKSKKKCIFSKCICHKRRKPKYFTCVGNREL